jgi:hypothetical protein
VRGFFFNIKETLLTFLSLFFLGCQILDKPGLVYVSWKERESFNIKETLLTFLSLFFFRLPDFWMNWTKALEYKHFLYSEPRLRKCQSVQQNFAQMYDISKNFFILYDECLIFIPNLVKMYIQSY